MNIIKYRLSDSDKIISIASRILKKGGLLVVPTDTVYGLAVDAKNQQAVDKLLVFKNRPVGRSVSVFVENLTQMNEVVSFDKKQQALMQRLLPGPFTMVLPSKNNLASGLTSEKGTLGVRMAQFDLINKLVKALGGPITATSANISGRSPHYSVPALLKATSDKKRDLIDLVIDFGQLTRNKPSTVVDLTGQTTKIIRQGDLMLDPQKQSVFVSKSPSQTQKIARFLLGKYQGKIAQKPLIFLLEGELGTGKTIFVKGMAAAIGIRDIISPTFVVYYEYKSTVAHIKNLYHFDLYNIEEADEFKYLGLEKVLQGHNLICIEWGEKSGQILDLLKQKGAVVYVKMHYRGKKERELAVNSLNID